MENYKKKKKKERKLNRLLWKRSLVKNIILFFSHNSSLPFPIKELCKQNVLTIVVQISSEKFYISVNFHYSFSLKKWHLILSNSNLWTKSLCTINILVIPIPSVYLVCSVYLLVGLLILFFGLGQIHLFPYFFYFAIVKFVDCLARASDKISIRYNARS